MSRCFTVPHLLLLALPLALPGVAAPLFRWDFADEAGNTARDTSGNGLDGTVTATWQTGDSGTTLFFDGTAATQVTIDLPADSRLGAGSWTFSAWIRPDLLGMPESPEGQNTRRMFSYGNWPQAIITLNISGNGSFGCFMSYRDVNDRRIDGAAASADGALQVGEWAHVVMVCDREKRQLRPYINGVKQGAADLPEHFAGDFGVYGNLSVGNGWQNFKGAMGPVAVYREALSTVDILRLFREHAPRFGFADEAELAAREEEALQAAAREEARLATLAAFAERNAAATTAWEAGDLAGARRLLADIARDDTVAPESRSYALLRLASACLASGDAAAAATEYARLAANDAYPAEDRNEARERIAELARTERGLTPRDPAAARTAIADVTEFAAEVHIAPNGSDDGDGSPANPFASLGRARDAVRALRADGVKGSVCVRIGSGEYRVTEALALSAADSGTADGPVVYRAAEPGKAVFYGGARVSGFVPVTDPAILARLPEEGRGKVWQADLRAQGITDYGELRVRGGIGQPPAPPTLEVFFDGRPMTPARWPNEGFIRIRELLEPGSARDGKPSVFGYLDDRHARWTQANDLWLMGYWHFLWADATIKVGKIDTEAKTVTTEKAYEYDGRGMDNGQGIIYYAFNLLEEIDRPEEWYLDREAGMLYLYPPQDMAGATVEIGMHPGPMMTFDDVSHVRVEGLVFDLGRYTGIQATNSSDCLVAGCTLKRLAASAITVNGGKRFGVFGCDLHTLGRRGVELGGGNRETLEPAGHFVENCTIHDFGRVDRTYTQGVTMGGVGCRLSHSLIYDCPTSVVSLGGNEHVIEYNDFHSAVRESDDQGGIDMWGNPTFRGNIFRYNHFRNIGKTGSEHAAHGQAAIRFDDTISGQIVYGNILCRGSNGNFGAVQMNSGRDNIFFNNVFVDNRHAISGGWYPANQHWADTREGRKPDAYTTPLYLERYPMIARMFEDGGRNYFRRNLFWQCGTIGSRAGSLDMFENAVFADDEDPGFVDAKAGNFALRPDAAVLRRIAFRPIPVDEIGLYAHPLRASWPVTSTPVEKADWRIGFERPADASGAMPHALAVNPVHIPLAPAPPTVDGRATPDEWPVEPRLLKEDPSRKPVGGPAVRAWLMHDRENLYVAVRVPFGGDARSLAAVTGAWGQIDGVEICVREKTEDAAKKPPTLILQGFPNGKLLGAVPEGQLSTREATTLARLSRFAATVDEAAWTGEWTIPVSGIGMAYAPGVRLQFNIGVRRTKPDEWVALAGALGANYQLQNAAVVVLE